MTVYQGWQIFQSEKIKTVIGGIAHLIYQTWRTVAEVNSFVRWIASTNGGELRFVGNGPREWEKAIVQRVKGKMESSWKTPAAVHVYLEDRRKSLRETCVDLEEKYNELIVCSSD